MKSNIFDESWRQNVKKEYEADVYNTEKALQYTLILLSETLETDSRIENKCVYCPDMDMTVTPRVLKLSAQNVILGFVVYSPKWGDEMVEQSQGLGGDTAEALSVAVSSFVYSFVDGLVKMETGESADNKDTDSEIATIFGGKTHKWRAYLSDVVTIGNAPDVGGAYFYWNKLKKFILKRLGNQKVCCVRVYLDRIKGDITGECRIDNELSVELSLMLVNEVAKWKAKEFASHKAYFFIRQEDETLNPYPYIGPEGKAALRKKIKTAVDMFYDADTEEKYNDMIPEMKKALNDDTLAAECLSFIPEICAERAFRDVRFSEMIEIAQGEKSGRSFYKSQVTDYRKIKWLLFELFNEGVFGSVTNEIFNRYIDRSAVKNALMQIREKGMDLKSVKMEPLEFKMEEDFEIR